MAPNAVISPVSDPALTVSDLIAATFASVSAVAAAVIEPLMSPPSTDIVPKLVAVTSAMWVNNEVGVMQDVPSLAAQSKAAGALFHTDAVQAFGKLPLVLEGMGAQFVSFSGHKIYAPKGIGALYVRRKPRVRLAALINGGGQERGMRSGTISTPLAVALGEAAAIAKAEMDNDYTKIKKLSDRFIDEIISVPEVYLNGDRKQRYPGCVNLSFACIEGESMIGAIKDLAVSSGSACTSSSLEPSYVLRALGIGDDLAHTSIRFGIGKFTTEDQVEYAIDKIKASINKLRDISPLWEMMQEGIDLKSINWSGH
jgi:cysteine desulfurase